MFCVNCGTQCPDGSNFCMKCGYNFAAAVVPAAPVVAQPAPVVAQPVPVAQPVQVVAQPVPGPIISGPPPIVDGRPWVQNSGVVNPYPIPNYTQYNPTFHYRCEYCYFEFDYHSYDLGHRAWYPHGFVYCPRCKKPLRHRLENEVITNPTYAQPGAYQSVPVAAPIPAAPVAPVAAPAPVAPAAAPVAPVAAQPAPAPAAPAAAPAPEAPAPAQE